MSSTAPPAAAATEPKEAKEKSGLGKVLSRVKTVLRKSASSSARRKSFLPAASTAAVVAPATTSTAPPKKPQYEGATSVSRKTIHEERAKKLARFGFEINPSEWHSTEGNVLRVEKPIRVRIHRECHNCKAAFSNGNQCPSCNHMRCKHCVRDPPRRSEAARLANREKKEALIRSHQEWAPIIPHYGDSDSSTEKIVLTRPSKTGGQDLIYKKARQRTRRTCHNCNTIISSPTRICDNCNHKRCGDCPRSPAGKDKYPYGYPNDEPGEKQPAFYSCQDCKTKFPADAPDGTECSNASCSHKKCTDCQRVAPHKVEPGYKSNPDALAGLHAQLAKLNIVK